MATKTKKKATARKVARPAARKTKAVVKRAKTVRKAKPAAKKRTAARKAK